MYLLRCLIRKLPGKIVKLIKLPDPEIIDEFGGAKKIGEICKSFGFENVLLVSDENLIALGIHKDVEQSLKENNITYSFYITPTSEPNLDIVENGRRKLENFSADAIIALGGGAVLDACKMIAAAAILKKRKTNSLLKKFLIVEKKTLPIISIPTTAGTGAELTVGCVVKNKNQQKKASVIVGLNIKAVILDGELMINTPNSITCACGFDALSHGLEGVVSATKVKEEDMNKSMECVKLVLNNLYVLIDEPKNIASRQKMCLAANYGGNAINKQLAGYVHAFAHTLGSIYHIPHGNAIAMCLIPIMEFQKNKCLKKLALLSKYCELSDSNEDDEVSANKLLDEISKLKDLCNFRNYNNLIEKKDYKLIYKGVVSDSINYSAPLTLKRKDVFKILDEISK